MGIELIALLYARKRIPSDWIGTLYAGMGMWPAPACHHRRALQLVLRARADVTVSRSVAADKLHSIIQRMHGEDLVALASNEGPGAIQLPRGSAHADGAALALRMNLTSSLSSSSSTS